MPPSAPIKVFSYFPHLAVPADSVPNKQKDVLPRPSKKAKQNTPSSFLGQQSEPVGCSSGKGLGNKRKAQTEGISIIRKLSSENDRSVVYAEDPVDFGKDSGTTLREVVNLYLGKSIQF